MSLRRFSRTAGGWGTGGGGVFNEEEEEEEEDLFKASYIGGSRRQSFV
jgi:hypothetical protein